MWSFSLQPTSLAPPCTLITAQAPPHLLSFLKSSFSQPQECQAILSGSSASPVLLSHVRMCHSAELCRYMLGGIFFSICTRSTHTNGLRTKQGVLSTSPSGPRRPFYHFYIKIFLLCPLLTIVLTNVNYERSQREECSMYSFTSNIILNIRMMRTSEESFLPRLSFEVINFNTKGRWKKIHRAFNTPVPPDPMLMRKHNHSH